MLVAEVRVLPRIPTQCSCLRAFSTKVCSPLSQYSASPADPFLALTFPGGEGRKGQARKAKLLEAFENSDKHYNTLNYVLGGGRVKTNKTPKKFITLV